MLTCAPNLTLFDVIAVVFRPDGHDPRDQYIGHKRIDVPIIETRGKDIAEVRFNCIRLIRYNGAHPNDNVHIRQFSLHKKVVPWE